MPAMACEPPPDVLALAAAEATDAERTPRRAAACTEAAPGASGSVDEAVSDSDDDHPGLHKFVGEWDDEGVYFYQAFNDEIADWAMDHQMFGGPKFNPDRMTWIKPSFAWMLYRAGYGLKDKNQSRVLKVKLSHEATATILAACSLAHEQRPRGNGRVQWDPARSLWRGSAAKQKGNMENTVEPRRAGKRAIQIGMKGELSRFYVESALSIQDVSALAREVHDAHALWKTPHEEEAAMRLLQGELPDERLYVPRCEGDVFDRLHMVRG